MKLRKINSKLTLNKSTVANLGTNELKAVLGGYFSDNDYTCPDPCQSENSMLRCQGMITHEPGCPDSVNPVFCDLSASSI